MIDPEIQRFFLTSWTILILLSLLPIYLARFHLKLAKRNIQTIIITVILEGLGYVFFMFATSLTETEFELFLFFIAFLYLVYLMPRLDSLIKETRVQELELTLPNAHQMMALALRKVKGKPVQAQAEQGMVALVTRSYGIQFFIKSKFNAMDNETKVTMDVSPNGRTITYHRVLYLAAIFGPIMAMATGSFQVQFPFLSAYFDSEMLFFITAICMTFFLIFIKSQQEKFFIEFEMIQKDAMMELVQERIKSMTKPAPVEEKEEKSGIGGFDLKTAREKAEQIKKARIRESLEAKRKEFQDRVDSIFDKDGDTAIMDNEFQRKHQMIIKMKDILISTPMGHDVTLKDIQGKLPEETSLEEIEKVILGLLRRKEVVGTYDIWEQKFSLGDAPLVFVDKTLKSLDINDDRVDYVKITRDGDVEIRFNKKDDKEA